MNLELVGALNELERERGISKEILLEAIEAAIVSAYKRNDGDAQNVRVNVSEKSGQIQVFAQKEVVEDVEDSANEISLQAARAIDPNYDVGDTVEIEVTPRDFGRIAAQTAKQVVIQRIREAERALIFEEYSNREGDVVTGIVQRSDYRNVLIDLGKVEAILPPSEQIPKENYSHGTRLKTYVSEVRQTTKGPQVIVSRTHPGLLKRLFELEVPEIHDGVVELRAVAREAGNRSKIAVSSTDDNVDPVGACVGPRGMRVQAVVQELKGEKIDIIEYSADPERFIGNALSPARVMRVYTNDEEKTARAVVPDHQLSLAIGREGQNARLAARLTGWKIDIKSDSQMAELAILEAQRAEEEEKDEVAEDEAAGAESTAAVDEVAVEQVEVDEPAAPDADVAAREPVAGDEAAIVSSEEDERETKPDEDDRESVAEPIAEAVDQGVAAEVDAAAEVVETETPEEVVAEAEVDLDEDVEDEEADEDDAVDSSDDEDELDLEIPDDVFEELDETESRVDDTQPKVKKNRAAKKAELQDMIEEDVLEDDEDLPTLFGGDEKADDDEELVFVADDESAAEESAAPTGGSGKKGRKGSKKEKEDKSKDRFVLRDLAELKSLLDQVDSDES